MSAPARAASRPRALRMPAAMPALGRATASALLLAPGALTVYFAFNGGGFFAGTQGAVAVALALALLLRATLAEDPFPGASRMLGVAAGALTLFAAWTLLSSSWSDAPARALLEFNRALLYVLALLLFGTLPMTGERLRWMVRGLAAAAVAVCTVAFITRALPDVWPITPNIANNRLSYPITYWNTLGLLASLGIVLCLQLTTSVREPRAVRVFAAAAQPVLVSTLYLTLSRGGIAAGVVGVAVFLLMAWPRGLLAGLLASVPAMAVAVSTTYAADKLETVHPTTPAAVAQGHHAARVVAACVAGAALVRLLGLWLDARIDRRRGRYMPRRVVASVAVGLVVVVGAGAVAAGAPGYVSRQYKTFVQRTQPKTRADLRARLTDPSSNGRIDEWRVALRGYRAQRLHGSGAGTYQLLWNRHRPYQTNVFDGHSLYFEVLGELGIVGLLLVGLAILTILVGAARRIRGPDRALYAGILAALLTWAVRAGADWDWEMPVVTFWMFALGGAVLATPVAARGTDTVRVGAPAPGRLVRVVVGLGCLLLAVTPFRVAQSQSHLNASVRDFNRGDCRGAIGQSLASNEAIGARPEPREILAICDVRLGYSSLAVKAIDQAVRSDPGNWEYRYVSAVVGAAAGRDPRAQAREALKLNPREELAQDGVKLFGRGNPRLWRKRATTARLPQI